jgi:hypothetical protein
MFSINRPGVVAGSIPSCTDRTPMPWTASLPSLDLVACSAVELHSDGL